MKTKIRVLYIDDYQLDRELVRDALEIEHGIFHITEAATYQEFEKFLSELCFDIVLSDFNIFGFNGLDVIDMVYKKNPDLPIIIVTGTGSEEIAVKAMKKGAVDYVIKTPDHIRRLSQTIIAAIEKKRLMVSKKLADEELTKYRDYLEELVGERTKELKKTQEKLNTAEQMTVLGHFSGNLSHEIRNTLGVIHSSVYYLMKKLDKADPKIKEHLVRIQNQVKRSTSIIESLLKLTKMKKFEGETINLVSVVIDSILLSELPQTIKIVKQIPDEEIFIWGDYEQLIIAFRNIIKNAIDAIDENGVLTIQIKIIEENQFVEVIIKDTGVGIKPDILKMIFEPLFSTKKNGIGFGMSICKQIINKHNGVLDAISEINKGTDMIVRLPIYFENEML